ncbi:MAG: hypothetical protein KDA41_11735, partial [Planctomycetales bacterium]|nr:hypothetical protein [Planctomycetales bacterium]
FGPAGAASLSPSDIQALAFPAETKTHLTRRDGIVVISDEPSLDAAQLADHLQSVAQRVQATFPTLSLPPRPIVMIVFAREEDYRDFPRKLGRMQNADAARPTSGGYTIHGVATSYFQPEFGSLRPVFTHEYVHALLAAAARLQNRGDWFQEGAATYFQVQFHPQDNLSDIVARGVADRRLHLPLKSLCDGRRIPMNRYWQAMTVVGALAEDDDYRERTPALLEAFAAAGSSDLSPHLESVLHTDWESLERRWKEHCQTDYAR